MFSSVLSSLLIQPRYSWAQVSRFSLPLPTAVFVLSLFFPIAVGALMPLAPRLLPEGLVSRRNSLVVLTYLSSLVPVVLLVVSLIFATPTSLQSCSLETAWAHLFQSKDERAITTIQDNLRCCGFNSVRDRAWPFPAKGIDAGECERTQGYHVRCLEGWRRQESHAAGSISLASLSNWLLIVRIYTPLDVQRLTFEGNSFSHGADVETTSSSSCTRNTRRKPAEKAAR